jgi:hypothetical protein
LNAEPFLFTSCKPHNFECKLNSLCRERREGTHPPQLGNNGADPAFVLSDGRILEFNLPTLRPTLEQLLSRQL